MSASHAQASPYTREEIAAMEAGHTMVSPALARGMAAVFLLTILSVPIMQQVIEVRAGFAEAGQWRWPRAYDVFSYPGKAWGILRDPDQGGMFQRLKAANRFLADGFRKFEEDLEEDSAVARSALPHAQALTADFLGLGNEQVNIGRGGWLFYHPDVNFVTGPPFLDSRFLELRSRGAAGIQPDPLRAIRQFREQLKMRDIHLIVMPVPVKPMLEPEHLAAGYGSRRSIPIHNPSHAAFLERLDEHAIDYLDVSTDLARSKWHTGADQFLRTDTHWTPQAMELAATLLAKKIQERGVRSGGRAGGYTQARQLVEARGDIAVMLNLPATSALYAPERAWVRPVSRWDGSPWTPDSSSPILVLGDSFANIYSLAGMGWGTAAGFVEQLSCGLQQPVDSILRNDKGAFATREVLASEITRGHDRLRGKQVVVWMFAARELAEGNWKSIPLEVPTDTRLDFLVLPAGEKRELRGTIKQTGSLPRPGTTPYKDFLTAFHLALDSTQHAIVYLQTMKDHVLTDAARLRPGDEASLVLTSWTDAEGQFGGINRGELEDLELQLQEPNFGTLKH